MNRAVLLLILLILPCLNLLAHVRVLAIGISEYPESSGWNRLNADNDVRLMKTIFPNAEVLENREATRSGIESRLKDLAKNVARGDTVIIHFSGHGQQIITEKSGEEIDRVDEAIVPYDAAKCKSVNYKGDKHITDDVFGKEMEDIRKAAGPEGLVIALIDACHSDSMERGTERKGEIYRGTEEIFGAEEMSASAISKLSEAYHNQEQHSLEDTPGMGKAIYISACESDRRNYEVVVDNIGYGSLTYYFVKAYKEKGMGDLSTLLSAIYDGMKKDTVLQFHGQLPAIRNNIGWEAPMDRNPDIPEPDGRKNTPGNKLNPAAIAGMTAGALIIILTVLWMIGRKRK